MRKIGDTKLLNKVNIRKMIILLDIIILLIRLNSIIDMFSVY